MHSRFYTQRGFLAITNPDFVARAHEASDRDYGFLASRKAHQTASPAHLATGDSAVFALNFITRQMGTDVPLLSFNLLLRGLDAGQCWVCHVWIRAGC